MQRVPQISPQALQAAHQLLSAAGFAVQHPSQVCSPSATQILKGLPNYSRIRFNAARTGAAAPWTYTCDTKQERLAFSYGLTQDMSTQGFPSPTPATRADTNIRQAGRTNGGENIEVRGISIAPVGIGGVSDALFALNAMPELAVSLVFEGGEWELGPAEMMPGGTGLYGSAFAPSSASSVGAMSSGIPAAQQFFPIAGGFRWAAEGTDSLLYVKVKPVRDIVFAVSPAAAPPANIALDLRVQLHGVSLQNKSANQ